MCVDCINLTRRRWLMAGIMGDDSLLSETIMLLRPAAGEKEGAEDMEAVLKAVVDCASSRDSLKAASMSKVSSFLPKAGLKSK